MADGKINIEVKLDATEAKRQAKSLGKDLGNSIKAGVEGAGNDAEKSGERVGDRVTKGVGKGASGAGNELKKSIGDTLKTAGKDLEQLGESYSKAVSLPIAAAATAAGVSAIKIDTALTGVKKTLDATDEQYQKLKDSAIEFSLTNAVDPATILDIEALGAQLGFAADELDEFGRVVSGLELSTNLDAETAATQLAQFFNIMQTSHDEVSNYGAAVVDLGNHFATTEADVSNMALRIAGAGKSLGMTEADVLGLATALSSLGIKAEMGGSAISTIMSTIDKEVATNGDHLEEWAKISGKSVDEFKESWGNDVVATLEDVLKGLDGASQAGGSMAAMLEGLDINAIRQTDTMKRLATSGDLLSNAVARANAAWGENAALNKEVENRNASLESQLTILWNRLQAVAVEVGGPLVEALIAFLDSGQPILDFIKGLADAFVDMDTDSQRSVITIGAIVAGLGPLTTISGKAAKSIGKLADSFKKNYDAALKSSQNVKKVSTASESAAGGVDKLRTSTDKTKNNLKSVGDNAKNAGKGVAGLGSSAKDASGNVAGVGASAKTAGTGLATAATQATKGQKAFAALSSGVKTLGASLARFVPALAITAIATLVSNIIELNARAKKVKDGTSAMSSALKSLGDTAKSAADKTAAAGDEVQDLARAANGTSFSNYIAGVESVDDAIDTMIQRHQDAAQSISDAFSDTTTSVGMLDIYIDTIEDLTTRFDENGNKVALTKDEQAKLKWAVEGANDVLGTQYSVVDAGNGVLSNSTGYIKANADAWRDRALAQAASNAYSDALEEQIRAQADLNEVTENTRSIMQKYGLDTSDLVNEYGYMSDAAKERIANLLDEGFLLGKSTDEIRDAIEAQEAAESTYWDSSQSLGYLEEMVLKYGNSLGSSSDQLVDFINQTGEGAEASEALAGALRDHEVDFNDFADKLSGIGISVDELAAAMAESGPEGAEALVNAYLGTDEQLMEWAYNAGIGVPGKMVEGQREGEGELQQSSAEMVDGAAQSADEAAGKFTQVGTNAKSNMISGYQSIDGLEPVVSEIDGIIGYVDSRTGEFYDANAAFAQLGNAGLASADTYTTGADSIGSFMEGQNSQSVMLDAVSYALGAAALLAMGRPDWAGGGGGKALAWGNGFYNQSGYVGTQAFNVASGANRRMGAVRFDGTGRTGGMGYGGGIGSTAGYAQVQATGVSNAAGTGFKSNNRNASTWGDDLSRSFANGIKGAIGFVRGAANAVADVVKSILGHSVPKEGPLRVGGKGEAVWGRDLVENLADGISSSVDLARDAATEVADAVKGEFEGIGADLADGVVVGFENADPLSQLSASMKGGVSIANMVTAAQMVPSVTNNNQTVQFNQPVQSPDQVARTMRMQQRYGLAGRR